ANFKSKEELFLAMLDARFAERLEAVDRLLAGDGPLEERARAAGTDFDRAGLADPEWSRLFFEFAAYAAREPSFREELVTRYRALRHRMAELHRRAVEHDDAQAAKTAEMHEEIALMTCAMANGAALEHLLDPEDAPEDLFGRMVEIFVLGLQARAELPSRA
ncbi:MAG TPA: TetR family transcriptional regulator C-terminal domain-containing protein, partial [Solirubrobacteraceae bacterium]